MKLSLARLPAMMLLARMDALRVVDGELDNKYTPRRTPITVR